MLTSPSPAFPGLAGILPGGGVAGQALVCAPGSMSGAAWESIPGVPATRFGVVADGPTDAASLARNTVALQEFVDYIQTHHRSGLLPDGTIHINAPVDFSSTYYWAVRGGGRGITRVEQHADNVPIFDLGADAASYLHSWSIEGIALGYTNSQPTTNTGAIPIMFSASGFNHQIRDILFENGYYAFGLAAGMVGPWGATWDEIVFSGGLTGGAVDWSAGSTMGLPNNKWGRFTVSATNMVGPIFKNVHGVSWVIDTIEFLSAMQSPSLISFAAGTQVSIGSLKLEVAAYANTALVRLINIDPNCRIQLDNFAIEGSTPLSYTGTGRLYLIYAADSSSGDSRVNVGNIDAWNFTTMTGSGKRCLIYAGDNTYFTLEQHGAASHWTLTSNDDSISGNNITVNAHVKGRLSDNQGDANVTVALGGPNILHFSTALTAARTVTLPSTTDNLWNGLWYEVITDGAVNGANTLTVKAGATILRTIAADKVCARFTWRRNPSGPAGWVLTAYHTLP